LLQDVPVENVVERVELSLLIDAEQRELNLLANPTLKYVKSFINDRAKNEEALVDIIEGGKFEQDNLTSKRPSEFVMLARYDALIEYVQLNPTTYLTNWLENFFGTFMNYSDLFNYEYDLLSTMLNEFPNLSKVGTISGVIGKSVYVPQMVYQGLSQPYDRVGFDIFPISYYATNWSYADWFATLKGQKFNTSGVILPCFLNIRRPLDLTFFGINKVSPTQFFDAIYLQTGLTPEELKVSPAFLSPSTPDLEVWVYIRSNTEMLKILKEVKIVDGIHMYENNPAVDVNDAAYMTEVWVTFYPEQTKVVPLYQFSNFLESGKEIDKGWFTKSQFLKNGGTI